MIGPTKDGDNVNAYNPNVYVLGAKPEIYFEVVGIAGNKITPIESRISIREPSGTVVTVSGDDLFVGSGYLSLWYMPETIGWYQYEVWVKDGDGREDAATRGFEVIDEVY